MDNDEHWMARLGAAMGRCARSWYQREDQVRTIREELEEIFNSHYSSDWLRLDNLRIEAIVKWYARKRKSRKPRGRK